MRFGILGGTFDPIHLGHLRTAEEAGMMLDLERVFLIPSASPPHKHDDMVTTFDHRLAMVKMATAHSPFLQMLDLEAKRQGPSYSVETLEELHTALHPDPEIFFILGSDAFAEIDTWKEYQRLFTLAHFLVVERANHASEWQLSNLASLGLRAEETARPGEFAMSSGKTLMS